MITKICAALTTTSLRDHEIGPASGQGSGLASQDRPAAAQRVEQAPAHAPASI